MDLWSKYGKIYKLKFDGIKTTHFAWLVRNSVIGFGFGWMDR